MKRIAVIGLGNMGRHHVKHWKAMEGASLVAVCDADNDRAQMFATQFNCSFYTSIDALLEHEQLDAVSLTVPTFLHFEYAKKLIQKGISLLIEKPISQTLEEADALIALADKHRCILMIGHIERFNPAVVALKAYVDEGNLGSIVSVISRRANMFPTQMKDANVSIDLAVHDLDIVTYFLNEEPRTIASHFGKALIDTRPDHLDIFLTYPKASAFIQVNWITPTPVRKLFITGTKGYAELDYKDKTVTIFPSVTEQPEPDTVRFLPAAPLFLPIDPKDALYEELLHFLNCVITRTPPITSGKEGRLALSLALKSLS